MKTLYISQQGCYIALQQETLLIKFKQSVLTQVQLPHLEQILIFGQSQVTTPVIRACLHRDIPIAYLSRLGYCYGRLMPIERGYRGLSRYQQALTRVERLITAQTIVQTKIKNSRVILQRQWRKQHSSFLEQVLYTLAQFKQKVKQAETLETVLGLEGAAAAQYFQGLGYCFQPSDFMLLKRSKRPPLNPVNALLSFGYQVLWNHLLSLIELQGLDPYQACLHQGSERHAALASDLIEEFRAPLVDSLVLYLINRRQLQVKADFEFREGGCFLNNPGRRKYLHAFRQRMEEEVTLKNGEKQPKWGLLNFQVKAFKAFVYQPTVGYHPYEID